MSTEALSLSEQQQLIRAALAAVDRGVRVDVPELPDHLQASAWRARVGGLRYALADHDEDGSCGATGGDVECFAVRFSREILAAEVLS